MNHRTYLARIWQLHWCVSGLLLLSLALHSGCRPNPQEPLANRRAQPSVAIDGWGAESAQGDWRMANVSREFEFPRDHGAHPDYRIEWWYYTGNLRTESGRRFGYQLTFFRTGLQSTVDNDSRWAVRDLYTAHFAVSDVAERRLLRFERSNRGGLGWAGADEVPGRIWNGNWSLEIDNRTTPPVHKLTAQDRDAGLSLELRPLQDPVPHGAGGLSRKGPTDGNASYYYSFPRLATQGTLTFGGQTLSVRGESWMDHEFSSSFLEQGQQGWDWFCIQLDDGSELMLYQIRREDGSADECSSGTWIAADGSVRHLHREEFTLQPSQAWTSPRTSGVYPQVWQVAVPSAELELEVGAVFPDQEMDTRASTGIVYWEGCVDVAGTRGRRPISGQGYLEMTGRRSPAASTGGRPAGP